MINNDFLNRAIGGIDDDLIADAKFASVKRRSAVLMRIVPIAAAVAILAAGILAVFSMANRNKPTVPGADDPAVVPPVVDTEPEHTNTIVEGAFELVPDIGGSSTYVEYHGFANAKAYSYYLKNEKIYIPINYGFVEDFAKKLVAGEVEYPDNHYLINSNPTLYCFSDLSLNEDNSYDKPLINGLSTYIHIFDKEIPYFGHTIEVYEKYDEELEKTVTFRDLVFAYTEVIELDFSNVPAGESGVVIIKFGWSEPNNIDSFSATGRGVVLNFYVGENGVGFSAKSGYTGREYAKANVEKIENAQNSDSQIIEFDSFKDRYGID